MANWKRTVDIQAILKTYDEDLDADIGELGVGPEFKRVRDAVVKLLRKDPDLGQYAVRLGGSKNVTQFDRRLNEMYDAADDLLIWCGI